MGETIIDAEFTAEEPKRSTSVSVRGPQHGMADYMPEIRRSPEDMKRALDDIDRVAKEHMRDGIDYMVIPGTNKPTITKAGAERLSRFFGFFSRTELVERVIERGPGEPFIMYTYNTVVGPLNDAGEIIPLANAEGSANSWEAKWRYRNARPACPDCGAQVLIHTRKGTFWCPADKGGCGHSFPDHDARITNQQVGRVPNDDIWSQLNAIQKIAQKRSYVGAVLIATGSSEYFTQDMEDASSGSSGSSPAPKAEPTPKQEKAQKAQGKKATKGQVDDLFAVAEALGIPKEDVQAGLDATAAKHGYLPAELVERKLVNLTEALNEKSKQAQAAESEDDLSDEAIDDLLGLGSDELNKPPKVSDDQIGFSE